MSHLMYSNQDSLVTYDRLAAMPTPAPMGAFHRPVGFGDFLELVKHRLDRAGITIEHEEYVLDETGQTFFGAMQLGVDGFSRPDMHITLGVRGSHNQKIPRGLCLGSQVIVCSNLCFNGDLATMQTKQTKNIWSRLPDMVSRAVDQIPQMSQRENRRADAYHEFALPSRAGDAALVELHRRGALTASQIGRAVVEWDTPSFDEHAADGHTAWRLLQAVTEVQKPTGNNVNMDTVRQRTAVATDFIDSFVGLDFDQRLAA